MKLRESFEFVTKHQNGIIKNTRFRLMILSKFEPSKIRVTVAPNREKRSLNQNAYYWAVILPLISETTGHSPKELDRIYEDLFCPRKIFVHRGRSITLTVHCKNLSTCEFAEFLTRVIADAAELGIMIPEASFDHQLKDSTS